MIGQSVGSDASRLSCFLFRPRKSCEKRRKRSHTNVSNASVIRTSTPPVQTAHVCFHERKWVHTRLSEKDRTQRLTRRNRGPSLLRSQLGFVLPVKSILFRHAFIYIHFPVLCEPPLYQQREKSGEAAAISFIPTVPHCVFQLLAQTAHVRFHSRKWVHPRLHSKDRTQRLTRRNRGLHFCAIVQGI